MGGMGITKDRVQGHKAITPRAKAQATSSQGEGHSRSYHRVSVFCSTILVAGRPLVPSQAQPRLISRPLPSRGGVMQCGKATSQEGKDVHAVWFREVCIVNEGRD